MFYNLIHRGEENLKIVVYATDVECVTVYACGPDQGKFVESHDE
jgi:hypothetical protein